MLWQPQMTLSARWHCCNNYIAAKLKHLKVVPDKYTYRDNLYFSSKISDAQLRVQMPSVCIKRNPGTLTHIVMFPDNDSNKIYYIVYNKGNIFSIPFASFLLSSSSLSIVGEFSSNYYRYTCWNH